MFDCGMHMGYEDCRRFPDWQQLGAPLGAPLTGAIDCVVITHFHLDHCGALPHLTERLGYEGPIYMSAPTLEICRINLKGYVYTMRSKGSGGAIYSPADVDACLRRVTVVTLGATIHVDGQLRLATHYAGHVLGAVMFSATCFGQRVVYTGDFNTTADRHLGAARIGRLEPHVLITESTYATLLRDTKRRREAELCELVHRTVAVGGKVLIPCAAIGRPQELLLLLEQYWERMQLDLPIYLSGGVIERATTYYRLFHSWASEHVCETLRVSGVNPLEFRHVRIIDAAALDAPGPCVYFATPGTMSAGPALEAFRRWAGDARNLVLFPSHCIKGTIGHALLSGVKEISVPPPPGAPHGTVVASKVAVLCAIEEVWRSRPLPMKAGRRPRSHSPACSHGRVSVTRATACLLEQVSFAQHADAKGILSLIRTVRPQAVVLVHGERQKMAHLKVGLHTLLGECTHGIPRPAPRGVSTLQASDDASVPALARGAIAHKGTRMCVRAWPTHE